MVLCLADQSSARRRRRQRAEEVTYVRGFFGNRCGELAGFSAPRDAGGQSSAASVSGIIGAPIPSPPTLRRIASTEKLRAGSAIACAAAMTIAAMSVAAPGSRAHSGRMLHNFAENGDFDAQWCRSNGLSEDCGNG